MVTDDLWSVDHIGPPIERWSERYRNQKISVFRRGNPISWGSPGQRDLLVIIHKETPARHPQSESSVMFRDQLVRWLLRLIYVWRRADRKHNILGNVYWTQAPCNVPTTEKIKRDQVKSCSNNKISFTNIKFLFIDIPYICITHTNMYTYIYAHTCCIHTNIHI